MNERGSEFDVVIIGAGAAGLAAGRRLLEAGASVIALEARDRIGGRAVTRPTLLGKSIDLGCEWLHSADRNPWTAIARGLGFVIDDNLPDWGGRIARQLGDAVEAQWRTAHTEFEERMVRAAEASADRAAAELLPAGSRWNALLGAISSWANGVELERLSVVGHHRYADSGVNWRLLDGYGALIAAYGAAVPIRLSTVVHEIDHRGSMPVVVSKAGGVRCRAVIVTVPSAVLAADEIRFTPPLPDKLAAATGLPLGIANKLFLRLDGPAEDFSTDRHILGATDRVATGSYQLRPHGWPMIAGYFGGRLALELETAGAEAMAAFAVDELAALFGNDLRRRVAPLASSAWAGDPFARGSYSFALPGQAGARAILAAPVDGRLFFAGEACSPDWFSTAHGAYLSGRAAAEDALSALGIAPPSEPAEPV